MTKSGRGPTDKSEGVQKVLFVHTETKAYKTTMRLCELEKTLPEDTFVRISNSVIIRRQAIKRVPPALGQKFYLTLRNHDKVDVTRTYYYRFKDYLGCGRFSHWCVLCALCKNDK